MPRSALRVVASPHVENMIADTDVRYREPMPPLLVSYTRSLRAANLRPSTIDHYVGASLDYYRFAAENGMPEPTKARREHIEAWIVALQDAGYAQHTVRNRFVGLRRFIAWLVDEGEIARNPTERVRMPKADQVDKDVATKAELRAVLKAIEKRTDTRRFRDVAIVAMVYDTGLRATELASLQIADVNLEEGVATVRSASAKARAPRVVGLSEQCVRYLDRYLRKRKDSHSALYVGHRGQMTRSGVYQVVRDAFRDAGVTATIGPHDLRHTSASHIGRSMSESELMSQFGWRDADMARHYRRQVEQEMAIEAHRKASPLANL